MTVQPGDRVQITGVMPDDPDPLPIGSQGTVVRLLDSARQADVDWDNGRTLLLLLDVDPFVVIGRAPLPEITCKDFHAPEPIQDEDQGNSSPEERTR